MKFSKTDLGILQELARLNIPEKHHEKLSHQLESILSYCGKLQDFLPAVTLEGDLKKTTMSLVNPFFPTYQGPSLGGENSSLEGMNSLEEILARAPHKEGPFFLVPRVIDQDS